MFSIQEDFLTFIPVHDLSGEGLANSVYSVPQPPSPKKKKFPNTILTQTVFLGQAMIGIVLAGGPRPAVAYSNIHDRDAPPLPPLIQLRGPARCSS